MSAALRTLLLTAATLCCFAANSILTRIGLRDGGTDPLAFAAIRVAAGALMLVLLLGLRRRAAPRLLAGDWGSAMALVLYMAAFSAAYRLMPAGVGALVLFAVVQVTMIGSGLVIGERPRIAEWLGVLISFAGLLVFLAPGLERPPLAGSLLMIAAGVGWAAYSLRGRRPPEAGRGPADPLAATAGNFLRSLPLIALPWLAFGGVQIEPLGLVCALASGAIASGLGYALWYSVLPALTALRASLLQLTAPLLVTVYGLLFLGERATPSLLLGGSLIVGGLALATLYRSAPRSR